MESFRIGVSLVSLLCAVLLSPQSAFAAAEDSDREALKKFAFHRSGTEADKRGYRSNALLILHRGQVILEEYDRGFSRESIQPIWSVGKGIGSLLIGIAVHQGRLSLNDSICRFFPETSPAKCGIQVRHLLEMTSGLEWLESYDPRDYFSSSALHLDYGVGMKDTAKFVLNRKIAHLPGEKWNYSTGDNTLLMAVLKKVYSPKEYEKLPWTELFDVLGMRGAVFERDSQGVFHSGSFIHMRAIDLLKIGELLLNQGVWKGRALLPKDWVSYSSGLVAAFPNSSEYWDKKGNVPAPSWWLNLSVGGRKAPWPSAPEDVLAGIGFLGQFLFVIPSAELVIVRLGNDWDQERPIDRNRLLELSLNWVRGISGATKKVSISTAPGKSRAETKAAKVERGDRDGFFRMLAAYYAKEYCSCRFVAKRSPEFCWDNVKQSPSLVSVSEDGTTVKARAALVWTRKARFLGSSFGCLISDDESVFTASEQSPERSKAHPQPSPDDWRTVH